MAGRPRKYTPKKLEDKVSDYFKTITRTIPATEEIWEGDFDKYGHKLMVKHNITNNKGETMMITEYILPPTVGGLCKHLGITYPTWEEYCDHEMHPEFSSTTTRARGAMLAYLQQELLTRKDVKGVIFNLQNNYGYSDKRTIDIGEGAGKAIAQAAVSIEDHEALLKEIAEEWTQE